MQNKVIFEALEGFRELLFNEITEELNSRSSKRVILDLTFPGDDEEAPGNHLHVNSIFLDKKGCVMVKYTDDTKKQYTDGIDCFSVDQILKIILEM